MNKKAQLNACCANIMDFSFSKMLQKCFREKKTDETTIGEMRGEKGENQPFIVFQTLISDSLSFIIMKC